MILDATGVDHLWIAGHHVDWRSGEPDQSRPDGREAATHCSAFVAAISAQDSEPSRRGPPEHPQELLASAQYGWLCSDGPRHGWRILPIYVAAQRAANRGDLALEAFENPDPHRAGHIAMTAREQTLAELNSDGPPETQAGAQNAISTTTAAGFHHHRGAWIPGGGGSTGHHAHAIDWKSVEAGGATPRQSRFSPSAR